jgi:hypothetical protein
MRKDEIKVGKTYIGKRGKIRTVTAIDHRWGKNREPDVFYNRQEPWNNSTKGSMWLPYFAKWAKEEVNENPG